MISFERPLPALHIWLAMAACLLAWGAPGKAAAELQVSPTPITLDGPEASLQVLVTQLAADGARTDRTRQATYAIENAELVSVDNRGMLLPRAEGRTTLLVEYNGAEMRVPVQVTGLQEPRRVSFRGQVIPLLTKAGCNSGGCHGKAEGQNGFKLSVFGFDAESDHAALVKEGRGRRLQIAAPANSLLLRKASAAMPHGGGRQMEEWSPAYRRLLRWIREGAALDIERDPQIAGIQVEPAERTLTLRGVQQLRVVAVDEDGVSRDVTAEADFESNDTSICSVDSRGLVQGGDVPGEAAILVRYLGQVTVARIAMPRPGIVVQRPAENNFIDGLVWDKLQRMGIQPSGRADDATFLRRVYLDTIGTLPGVAEARRFLADDDPEKRARLIDDLLEREEYADYWALRWADLLRVDTNTLGPESSVAVMRWLRRVLAENLPYDQFVRQIVTAAGHTQSDGPAPIYLALNDPKEISRSVSQLFLGVRIECAECHHHPFERWSQDDFFALAGYFTGLKRKRTADGSTMLYADGGQALRHPRTGQPVPTAPLGADSAQWTDETELDRREGLVRWMTATDNPYFARAFANRLWSHYLGRGLVEPLDDLRATNPATNEPLLDALADHLRRQHYDVKAFTRTVLNSQVYQRSSQTTDSNARDSRNFSHALDRGLPAEVLLDAICQVSGVAEKFNGWPLGARAIQLWDNRDTSYFLRIFGRPSRTTVCECDRGDAPSISQALHLMNSPELMEKIQHRQGRARALADSRRTPQEIIETLYLATLSRYPTDEERQVLSDGFAQAGSDRRAATEDAMWALMNSKEFLYNH